MATYCQNESFRWNTYGSTYDECDLRLCVTPDGSQVGVDLTSHSLLDHGSYSENANFRVDWVMELQRYVNGSWGPTIDTRSGYVRDNSPSHRTFSNIANRDAALRVKLKIYWGPEYKGSMDSTYWMY